MNAATDAIVGATEQGLEAVRAKWPRLYFALAHHRSTDGRPMTFSDRPWQEAIYKDNSRHMVVLKCVQVGMSEHFLCDIFTLASMGKRGMYLLPDDSWCAGFVADRLDGLLARVPEYRDATQKVEGKGTDSRRMKSIYGSTWKFAGTNTRTQGSTVDLSKPKAAFEFKADALIFDEYDEHDKSKLGWFYDRQASTKEPYTRLFGNPTYEGVGIHREFNKTDAKRWEVQCHCGHWQVLDWHTHFISEDPPGSGVYRLRDTENQKTGEPRPICSACGEPFNRLGTGRWTPTNPDGIGSGYAISRLFVGVRSTDMRELYDKFVDAQNNPTLMQNVYNQWLGKPYQHSDDKVTEHLLRSCAGSHKLGPYDGIKRCTAGVDQGKHFHVHISEIVAGKAIKRFMGTVRDWPTLVGLLKNYGVTDVVIDAQGGGYVETRQFLGDYDGSWMCYYRPKDKVRGVYEKKHRERVVDTNRTEACDLMVQGLKQGLVVLPVDWEWVDGGDFSSQMQTPNRVLDASTGWPIWTKGTDHHFHAAVYDNLAWLISGIFDSREPLSDNWRV